MTTLLIATRNAHKVEEIRAILGSPFRYLTLNDFPGAPKVVEDAHTFVGNAKKKAIELARWVSVGAQADKFLSPTFVLADDSGLEVDALNGAPGVHSARFAALDAGDPENSPDAANNAKLLRLLKNVPGDKRTGRFQCVIALAPVILNRVESTSPVCFADEFELGTQVFAGACEGRILEAPAGQGGFGYDPLFVPNGYTRSYAELGEETKNQLSHRARALEKLRPSLLALTSSI